MRDKMFLVALVTAAILASSPAAYCLGIGSPGKTLDLGGSSISGSFGLTEMEVDDVDVESKSIIFKGAVGAREGLTPYLKLGFADLERGGGFQGNLGFAWGGGVLFELVAPGERSGLSVDLDLQILFWDSEDGGSSIDVLEGQAALLGSMKSGGTTGYGGIALTAVEVDGAGQDLDESTLGHLFFGVDYLIDFNWYFSAEAHLFGQDSITLAVGYLF